MKSSINKRSAFTLVELLVAAGIIAMLLALVAISYPSINEREQLTRAVDKLRTGLLTARLWARRDQVVTGIRFDIDTSVSPPKLGYFFTQQPLSNDLNGFVNSYVPGTRKIIVEFPTAANPKKIKPNTDYKCIVKTSFTDLKNGIWDYGNDKIDGSFGYYLKNEDFTKHDSIILESDTPHRIVKVEENNDPKLTLLGTGTKAWDIYLESEPTISLQYKHLFRIIRNIEFIPLQEFNDFDASIQGLALTNLLETQTFRNQIEFLPSGQVLNSPANQIVIKLTQKQISPSAEDEEAKVFLDCISGTTRYTNP